MVVRSGFEVQLVSADTKIPFKEHVKDGKIYVEAEPDAEYYIAIRRVNMEGPPVITSYYYVDEAYLGYTCHHERAEAELAYRGVWSRFNGVSTNTAFQFAKPSRAVNREGYRGVMEKGKPNSTKESTTEFKLSESSLPLLNRLLLVRRTWAMERRSFSCRRKEARHSRKSKMRQPVDLTLEAHWLIRLLSNIALLWE